MSEPLAVADPVQTLDEPAWWFLDTLVVQHRLATGTAPVVLEMTLPVGAAPPLHIHHGYDDSSYLLDGSMVVRTGDELRLAAPGFWLSTPRGTPHTFRVVGDRPARILVVDENDMFLRLICELGEPAASRDLPLPGRGPDPYDVFRAFAEHDTAVIGPSLNESDVEAFLAQRA